MISRYRSSSPGIAKSAPYENSSREQLIGFGNGVDQGIDFRLVVVDVERSPGGGADPEAAHQRLGAVVTGPHAHPRLVQHLRQVVRMDVLVGERDDPAALGRF